MADERQYTTRTLPTVGSVRSSRHYVLA